MLPHLLNNLTNALGSLPGIGKKSASKLALDYLNLTPEQQVNILKSLLEVNKDLGQCRECFFFSKKHELCEFCSQDLRDHHKILVVCQATDVLPLEETGIYNGLYHVLVRLISPLDGVMVKDTTLLDLELRIERFMQKATNGHLELILFLKNGFNGNTTTAYLHDYVSGKKWQDRITITKLAQGLPANFNPSSIDKDTLKQAIKGRA
jgi:recombination protein RecR